MFAFNGSRNLFLKLTMNSENKFISIFESCFRIFVFIGGIWILIRWIGVNWNSQYHQKLVKSRVVFYVSVVFSYYKNNGTGFFLSKIIREIQKFPFFSFFNFRSSRFYSGFVPTRISELFLTGVFRFYVVFYLCLLLLYWLMFSLTITRVVHDHLINFINRRGRIVIGNIKKF